jgi:hypothetical protein
LCPCSSCGRIRRGVRVAEEQRLVQRELNGHLYIAEVPRFAVYAGCMHLRHADCRRKWAVRDVRTCSCRVEVGGHGETEMAVVVVAVPQLLCNYM